MEFKNTLVKAAAVLAISTLAAAVQATTISITSQSPDVLPLPGSPATLLDFSGDLEWNNGTLTSAQILASDFCFTDDALGLPPISPSCGALAAVPILATGVATYDGASPAPGSTFEQAGSTFDGNSGLLKLSSYSPTFGINIFIDLLFDGDGTGTMTVTSDLGQNDGEFTYSAVPVPAAAWLFGSALIGVVGLNRKR